ncbi:hypothetical protein HDU87_001547 [Geranomyces variabilis]|uniref:Uncharacterized protein n=1 Tax=Geranomyces variabilis TaxID=109894 RepID=A0AAD5TMS5_9FUNG|nr:hypothetical protein HDU87_001547 [Geranomyces variabilis]
MSGAHFFSTGSESQASSDQGHAAAGFLASLGRKRSIAATRDLEENSPLRTDITPLTPTADPSRLSVQEALEDDKIHIGSRAAADKFEAGPQSKHSLRDSTSSAFDSYRLHDIHVAIVAVAGILGGLALAIVTHVASGVTVASEGWFNALHIVIGLICMTIERWAIAVVEFATRGYVGAALLGEDGIALNHVVNAVAGTATSALKSLYGDRVRLRKTGDYAAIGRRPNGLMCTAVLGAALAACMPIVHVLLILFTAFNPTVSKVAKFRCDITDYSQMTPSNFSMWPQTLDYFLADVPTAALGSHVGTDVYLAACHDVDGHDELEAFQVEETVQGVRYESHCESTTSLGSMTYQGTAPLVIGTTDFLVKTVSASCDDIFCALRMRLYTYGVNATVTECVVSSQTVSLSGKASFTRIGEHARSCEDFEVDVSTLDQADPFYAALWAESIVTFTEAVGRWPYAAWMGGLAFELSMDPTFNGTVTNEDAEHIILRLMGGLHRLLVTMYDSSATTTCDGSGSLGAGTIAMPDFAHYSGIVFGVLAAVLAIYMFSSERDIQLIVGLRNYRRAISALTDPMRFAAMVDRTDLTGRFQDMCDETPQTLAATGSDMLVSMGGDNQVMGPLGHACISTVEAIDEFSPLRNYKGRSAKKKLESPDEPVGDACLLVLEAVDVYQLPGSLIT